MKQSLNTEKIPVLPGGCYPHHCQPADQSIQELISSHIYSDLVDRISPDKERVDVYSFGELIVKISKTG